MDTSPRPRSRSHALFGAALTLALCSVATQTTAQLVDPLVGTWTLNVAKSKFDPGPPAKSGTVRFERAGMGLRVVADLTDAKNVTAHTEYTANFDGRDYPIKGVPDVDSVMLRRLSVSSSERIDKKGGKVMQTFTRTVSPDGRTLTVTQKSEVQGHVVNNVLIFERK
jgi:hypothetical protein